MKQRILVVGNGMVGHKFIDNIANHGDAEKYHIITFSEEPRLAYDRVQLSKYFSGSTAEDLALTTADYYREKNIEFILKDKVVDLDFENKDLYPDSVIQDYFDYKKQREFLKEQEEKVLNYSEKFVENISKGYMVDMCRRRQMLGFNDDE